MEQWRKIYVIDRNRKERPGFQDEIILKIDITLQL
jgi:hypothetical protein|tara:strand:- start:1708 stop:1812 length:105 start_codon:yes stop_codon:yes gene_type:complete